MNPSNPPRPSGEEEDPNVVPRRFLELEQRMNDDEAAERAAASQTPSPNASPKSDPGTPTDYRALLLSQSIIRCKDCDRPVLENYMPDHLVNCALIKEEQKQAAVEAEVERKRQQSEASISQEPSTSKPKTSLVVTLGDRTISASNLDDGGEKGKKKVVLVLNKPDGGGGSSSNSAAGAIASTSTSTTTKVPSSRSTRVPIPVDVDKHCGVINDKGHPCSRSLTCKSHSMGAKRSVPHRSQPYDILLFEWQKTMKPENFGHRKPVQPRVGPGSEAYGAAAAEGRKRKRGDGSRSGTGNGGTGEGRERGGGRDKNGKHIQVVGEWEESEGEAEYEGMIDSEEEVEDVLKGLAMVGKGRPLGLVDGMHMGGGAGFSGTSMFASRNLRMARLRDVLAGVFSSVGAGGA